MAAGIRAVLKQASIGGRVATFGLTGQMHGLVLLDEGGFVLRPAILWNDKRTQSQCDEIHQIIGKEKFIQITGNIALTGFTAPKILWVKENESDVCAKAAHILLPKDYVRFKLTGGEEVITPDWKSPMLKVKAPKVVLDPLEPISFQDVRARINTCQRGDFIGERDRASFLFLLDTGARVREACNMNIKDVDLNTGAVMIRYRKGSKTRMVFIRRTTRRAIPAYLRQRHDSSPALFISKDEERLTYDGLRLLLERRAKLINKPKLHGFRRTFSLNMLGSSVDIFVLQGLMGDADLHRRYFAQNDEDNQVAHMHGGPVDNNLGIQALCRTACDLRFYLPRDFQNWMSPSR